MLDDLVTAMINGDPIQTRLAPGSELVDGLQWEDENGFIKEVLSVKELTHCERFSEPAIGRNKTYVGKVFDVLDDGAIVVGIGKGDGVLLDRAKVNNIPEVGDSVRIHSADGNKWNVSPRVRNSHHER